MANIPGAPTEINFGVGDCAEEVMMQFMLYQQQYNEAFCEFLSAISGGNNTLETIREKHAYSGSGIDQIFVNPLVPLTENCCVTVSGFVCIPASGVPNQSQNPLTVTFEDEIRIKCDGNVVRTLPQPEFSVDVEPGGFSVIPKQTIGIAQNLEVSQLGKTPNPGQLTVCAFRNNNQVGAEVTLSSLIICQVELT